MTEGHKVDERVRAIARRLAQRTEEGQITWRQTDESGTFVFAAQSSSVLISADETRGGRLRVKLDILNSQGETVEELKSEWSPTPLAGFDQVKPWNADLEMLYTAARRSAMNVNSVLDALDLTLDNMPESPGDSE